MTNLCSGPHFGASLDPNLEELQEPFRRARLAGVEADVR